MTQNREFVVRFNNARYHEILASRPCNGPPRGKGIAAWDVVAPDGSIMGAFYSAREAHASANKLNTNPLLSGEP